MKFIDSIASLIQTIPAVIHCFPYKACTKFKCSYINHTACSPYNIMIMAIRCQTMCMIFRLQLKSLVGKWWSCNAVLKLWLHILVLVVVAPIVPAGNCFARPIFPQYAIFIVPSFRIESGWLSLTAARIKQWYESWSDIENKLFTITLNNSDGIDHIVVRSTELLHLKYWNVKQSFQKIILFLYPSGISEHILPYR